MTVEEKMGSSSGEDKAIDKFPIGMRVLAVDDDPTCLKVLENVLRACQYEVTVTNQAVTALKMLRENRNKYDLVISDVNMPDMDGFKLLELVGLEMDLPVIMLSAHSDTKLVMKGITHGACDYLLKPVRIEELKNIWQHVIRRKKVDPMDQNKSHNQENACAAAGDGATPNDKSDQNGNSNRKRKDQDEDEGDESDDDGHENEESSTQKKPRVVWSVELHRKFVGAVNQLGLDKAVPKKILDLMNVEGITRENVASHLQKYRLYLKRLSTVAPQAGMVTALGSKDSSYLRMGILDGFGDLRSFNSPGRLSSSALPSYVPGSMLGRLNSTAGLSMRGIASSGMIQPGHSQSLNTSFNTIGKIQQAMFPANQSKNLYQGLHTSLEFNQLPQSKSTTHIVDFNHINSPTAFTAATGFADARTALGSSSSSVSTSSSNLLILQANPHQAQSSQAYGNQSCISEASLNQDSFDMGVRGSSNFLDHSRCNESWQGAVQLSNYPSNSLPLSEPFNHDQVPSNNFSNTLSSSSCLDISSSMATSTPLEDCMGDLSCQAGLIGNVIQNYTSKQQWEEHKQDYNQNLNRSFSTVNSLVSGNCTMGPFSRSMDQSNASCVAQHTSVEKAPLDTKFRSNVNCVLEQSKCHDGFIKNNYDPLDDMMSAMIKQDPNETILMDGELGFDAYSLSSCM